MPSDPPDLVGVVIALLAFIVSKEVATTFGPYAAIMMLATAGASLSLSGSEENMGPWKAAWFVAIRVLLAIVITISFAELLQNLAPWLKPRYTMSPIAFGIGWIRDYNQIRAWFGRMIELFTTKRIDNGK